MTAVRTSSSLWCSAAFFTVILVQTNSIWAATSFATASTTTTTTTSYSITSASEALSTSSAPAQTHSVDVGNGNFQYNPDSIKANVNDIIEFRFFAPNHSVARAEYKKPCVPIEITGPGKVGFWSGFRPVESNSEDPPIFSLLINDTNPVFFYCSAPGSCIKNEMVGVVNPNSSMTLAQQKAAARSSNLMLAPGESIPNEDGTPYSDTPSSASTTVVPSATPVSLATPASADTPPPVHTKHISTGAIAGIAIAGATVVILLAGFIFLLGRHTSMKQVFKRLHHPASATPGSHDSSAGFPPGFQPPYSASFASPRSEMGKYAPPYDAPYRNHNQDGQMPELSSSVVSPTLKGLNIQRDQIVSDDYSREQTISPPLGSPGMHSELEGESRFSR